MPRRKMVDVDTIITKYSLFAKSEGFSPNTIRHTIRAVNYFAVFLGGIDDVTKVTADDLRRFIVGLQSRKRWANRIDVKVQSKISGTSINTYVRAIKAFWGWMQHQGIITKNPLADVSAPKLPQKLPKILTVDEIESIFKLELNSRDRAILMLLLDSGIRLSELASLTVHDLNITDNGVTVTGKGNKQRHIFVSRDTDVQLSLYYLDRCSELGQPKDTSCSFFLTHDGYPLTTSRIQKILERIGKRAGISQRLSPHKLRHSYATLSLKHGANLEVLRRSLGHTDIKTTEVYLSLTDADVLAAHKQFSPIANLRTARRSDRG